VTNKEKMESGSLMWLSRKKKRAISVLAIAKGMGIIDLEDIVVGEVLLLLYLDKNHVGWKILFKGMKIRSPTGGNSIQQG